MNRFERHCGVAAPLIRDNVDTDAIIPSTEMKRVSKRGLGEGLFAGWRYLEPISRQPNPEFILNQPAYDGTSILLSGNNFGCGSSREHAAWALAEYGIRAIMAPGFGGIFAGNCIRNGILPLKISAKTVVRIAGWVSENPREHRPVIDLPAQKVVAAGSEYSFDIDASSKTMLVEGLDAIALTLTRWEHIQAFHRKRKALRPWLY
ncbi:MAG: 3-isopropylmalate/(R)-2-methylmalate dehydratase small subunit [Alcanivorax sp.]|jgi:3-isopropylmalate/(R)-2-methylmalate dehydratase small subunit